MNNRQINRNLMPFKLSKGFFAAAIIILSLTLSLSAATGFDIAFGTGGKTVMGGATAAGSYRTALAKAINLRRENLSDRCETACKLE